MKKINWLLFTLFAFTVFACKDDEDPVDLDTTAPTITITSPTEGQTFNQGGIIPLQARIEDNVGLDEVVITVAGPGGSMNTFTRGASDFTSNGRVDELNVPIQIPADAATGTYTMTINATDTQGNQATEASVSVQVEEGTGEETAITFMVTEIPENTPEGEDIYISGEFAEGTWTEPGTNDAFMLTDNGDGTYSITLEPATDLEEAGVVQYKFFRGGGWGTGEQNEFCEGVDNRTFEINNTNRTVEDIQIINWEDVCEPATQEGSIDATGFDDGFNTLGGVDEEGRALGTPVTFNFTGAEGIDSVNVSARTADGRETVNQGYNQAWFDEQGIDNTGDFTFTDDVRFPNVTAAEGATDFTVTTFRDGQAIGNRTYNTNVAAVPGARRVNFNVTGPADMPENTRLFTSGNFQPNPYTVNDPNYELTRNAETGTYQTSMYTTGDLNYSYSALNEDGTTVWEVDGDCVEAVEGTGTRNYVFAERGDVDEDDFNEEVNFAGFGECP